jgi:hypothetical protein
MCGPALGLAMLGLMFGTPVAAQQTKTLDELETVVVTGEHPGPGLWKVSKGDHVMWVLGTHEPLPKNMTWRSRNVEARIGESQLLLLPGSAEVDVDIGFFRTFSLVPAFIRAAFLPDKKTLKDVLPAATYRTWLDLRQKYIGRSDATERRRPWFAMEELRDQAYRKSHLSDGPLVMNIARSLAKKRHVRVQQLANTTRAMNVKKGDIKKALEHMSTLSDVPCFTHDLNNLENDITTLTSLANAWAHGNIDALRDLHGQPEVTSACGREIESAMTAEDSADAARMKQLDDTYTQREEEAKAQLKQQWIAAARKSLDKNRSTFSILPIREVISPTGYLAQLQELGYDIEGP